MSPPARARLAQVNLVVSDMERSLEFYRTLGIEVGDMPEPWQAHHRPVTNPPPGLGMELDSRVSAGDRAPDWPGDRRGVLMGFAVDRDEDVDALVDALAGQGHRVLQQPHLAFFGARYAVVEDPNGITVGIMGPVDESRGWTPAPPG